MQQKESPRLGKALRDLERLRKINDWSGEILDKGLTIGGDGVRVRAGFRTRSEHLMRSLPPLILVTQAGIEGSAKDEEKARQQSQENLKQIGLACIPGRGRTRTRCRCRRFTTGTASRC